MSLVWRIHPAKQREAGEDPEKKGVKKYLLADKQREVNQVSILEIDNTHELETTKRGRCEETKRKWASKKHSLARDRRVTDE
jgi:hypothetical protein